MKKLFLFAALMTAAVTSATNVVVYQNNFTTATNTDLNGVEQGTPAVLWTATQNVVSGDAPALPFTTTTWLRINAPQTPSGAQGQNIVTAPLANYKAPFTTKLNEIEADSMVWTFNMRTNCSAGSGFEAENRSASAVLVCDNADILAGNGYAVVNNATNYYRLVKFTGGLSANANVTTLASTEKLTKSDGTTATNNCYMSFRIVYIPSTDTWKMYYFANTENSFVAPEDVTSWILAGSVVDATHTGKNMTHFGFMNKYYNIQAVMYIAKYQVMTYNESGTIQKERIFSAPFTAASSTEMADYSYGTPAVLLTNTKLNIGTEDIPATPTMQDGVRIQGVKVGGSNCRNILTAPMSNFGTPWTSKLNEIEADSVVWMFNMRNAYDNISGFNDGKRAVATVLAMDDADMMAANGYAVVSNTSKHYRLVRFAEGLGADANVTELATTEELTNNTRYMSFCIVYIPSTDTWKMYYLASAAFVAPENVAEWIYAGSVVDDTHTGKSMTHFGYMIKTYFQNTPSNPSNVNVSLYIKNYTLDVYPTSGDDPGTPTEIGLVSDDVQLKAQKVIQNGRLYIRFNGKLYNAQGQTIK